MTLQQMEGHLDGSLWYVREHRREPNSTVSTGCTVCGKVGRCRGHLEGSLHDMGHHGRDSLLANGCCHETHGFCCSTPPLQHGRVCSLHGVSKSHLSKRSVEETIGHSRHGMQGREGGGVDWRCSKRGALTSGKCFQCTQPLGYRHGLTGQLCKQGSVLNARHNFVPDLTTGSNVLAVCSITT